MPKDDEDDDSEEHMNEQLEDVEGSGVGDIEPEDEATSNEPHAHGLVSGTAECSCRIKRICKM